jgi:uncharacterized protein
MATTINPTRTRYSVLALDGGGIRGIIPARILQAIEERTQRPVSELFDLVAGTSTGGLVALGLTKPSRDDRSAPQYSAADLVALYRDHGGEIFPKSLPRRLANLGGLLGVRYPSRPIESLLKAKFGDTMMSQALTEVLVPSYDITAPAPFFFKRRYPREDPVQNLPMRLAARATSAAPTYFEPARFEPLEGGPPHALVDGGVFANNPSVSAYAEALDLWGHAAEIHVVSIGTGQPPEEPGRGRIPVPYARAHHWGLARWARPVLEVVFDGVADACEWQLRRLCRHEDAPHPRYHRLQSALPSANHALDDASESNLKRLLEDAEALIHEQEPALAGICEALEDIAGDRLTVTSGSRY